MRLGSLNDQIQTIINDFGILLPEATLIVGCFVMIILQLIYEDKGTVVKTVFSLFLLGLIALTVSTATAPGSYFDGLLVQSQVTGLAKLFFIVITGFVLLFPKGENLLKRGEYHFLIFMILLGAMLLIEVNNLLLFYLSLELVSITSYLLINFNFDRKGFEAGIKYLLFGAMASGLMLYGLSLIYGLTGTLDLAGLGAFIESGAYAGAWLTVALLLFFVGIWFKLSLAPMHIWTPDAYEAGPTPVVAYISVVPKVAVLIFLAQFVLTTQLEILDFDWKMIFSGLAIVSMLVGNLSALSQTNAKRMMAYSSIAHSGMLIIGIIVGNDFGIQALLLYAIVYAFMNIGAFYLIELFERQGFVTIKDLAGVGRKSPWMGVFAVVIMIALAGLPPTGGFTAKLVMFSSLWEYYQTEGHTYLIWLFGLGLLNTAIALFYYLKIPYYLWVHPSDAEKEFKFSPKDGTIVAIVVFLVLLSFFKADLLLNVLNQFNFAL
ncbi:NADH-quinone oxidoreductase subunit N [Reichenbachiella carrageenanivorans]|uniref:NADH-quinone oxidoreductase subunit N n=1 Tax=Reichenbachiella carrageenanivorans TaxID=2979869 RepID=A0ABY6D047_9BACT|nr:NADH-quinone oxidoreductase subunit N [Reichenbachiella carrageenanivorans]UXX79544.1 NADH-quinone oxidoreductase subunit N [Reichenbachiella carrageenanivorans]